MNVGSISLELLLDRAKFDQTIKQAERDAKRFQNTKVKISPEMDLGEVKDLGVETMSQIMSLNRWLSANPITPRVDISGLNQVHELMSLSGGTIKIDAEVRTKSQESKANNSCCDEISRAIYDSSDKVQNLLKEIADNTKKDGLLKTALNSTFGASIQGGFMGLGMQFSEQVTKEVRNSDRGRQASQATGRVASRVANVGISAATGYADVFFGTSKRNKDLNPIETMMNDIVDGVESIVDPVVFSKKSAEFRKRYFAIASKIEAGQISMTEGLQQVAQATVESAPRHIKNAVFRTAQAVSFPAKVHKEYQNERAARLVENFTSNIERVTRVVEKHPELENLRERGIERVGVAIGGHERKKGESSQQLSEMLRPFMDEKTVFVEVKNTFTDRFGGEPQSSTYDILKDALEPLGIVLGGEAKSMLSNLEVEMEAALKGMNPDAIKAQIIEASIKALFPEIEVFFVGFSGGGYPVEQSVSIAEARGSDSKGIAFGTPFFNLSDTASPEQFRSIVGYTDPLTFPYDKEAIGYPDTPTARKAAKGANDVPDFLKALAALRPTDAVDLVGESELILHDIQSYLRSQEGFESFREFIPGVKDINKLMDSGDIPQELQDRHSSIIPDLLDRNNLIYDKRNIARIAKIGKANRFLNSHDGASLEAVEQILDKPQQERTDKEKRLLNSFVGNVTEQLIKNLADFEKELEDLLAENAKKLGSQIAKDKGLKSEEEIAILQGKVVAFYQDLYQQADFKQNLEANKAKAIPLLGRAAEERLANIDTEGLDGVQKSSLANLLAKRESDDLKLLRGLDIYKNGGTSDIEAGYEFFNFANPEGKLKTELQGFREYAVEPSARNLQGTQYEEFSTSYARFLENLQAALARFVATGQAIPDEFIVAAEKILTAEDKLANFDFPDLISAGELKAPKEYFAALKEGSKRLGGNGSEEKIDTSSQVLLGNDSQEIIKFLDGLIDSGRKLKDKSPLEIRNEMEYQREIMSKAGVEINPSLLATAYRGGILENGTTGEQLLDKFGDRLLNVFPSVSRKKAKTKEQETENYNFPNPFDVKIPPLEVDSEIDFDLLIPLHQTTNDKLDTIISLIGGGDNGGELRSPVNIPNTPPPGELVLVEETVERSQKLVDTLATQAQNAGEAIVKSMGRGFFRGLDDLYKLAARLEDMFLSLDPTGAAKLSKRALQYTAVPALGVATASQIPGLGEILGSIHALIDLGMTDVAAGVTHDFMAAISAHMPDLFHSIMNQLGDMPLGVGELSELLRQMPEQVLKTIATTAASDGGQVIADVGMGTAFMKVIEEGYNSLQDRVAPELLDEKISAANAMAEARIKQRLPGDPLNANSPEIDDELLAAKFNLLAETAADAAETLGTIYQSGTKLEDIFTVEGLRKLAPMLGIPVTELTADGKPIKSSNKNAIANSIESLASPGDIARVLNYFPSNNRLFRKDYQGMGIDWKPIPNDLFQNFLDANKKAIASIDLQDPAQSLERIKLQQKDSRNLLLGFELDRSQSQSRGQSLGKLNEAENALKAYMKFGDINDLIIHVNSNIKDGAIKAERHWGNTTKDIIQNFNKLAKEAKEKGYDIQRFISEGSPGPSQRTRANWEKTAKHLQKQFEYIRQQSQISGSAIEQMFKANPDSFKAFEAMESRVNEFAHSLANDHQFIVPFETGEISEQQVTDSLQAIATNMADLEIAASLTFDADTATQGIVDLETTLDAVHLRTADLRYLWQQLVELTTGFAQNLQGGSDPLGGLEDAYEGYENVINNLPNSRDIFGGISQFIDEMSAASPVFGNIVGFVKDLGISALGILGFTELSDVITDGAMQLIEYGREFQRFDRAMTVAGKNGKEVYQGLYETAQQYGTSLTESMAGYTRLTLSSQGTGRQSTVDAIFPGFQKAFASRQSTPQQQARGFNAIEQMMSKGAFASAEELRQQLSEALPGAFAVAAQSMGMNMEEFTFRLYQGQIAVDELLRKMSAFYESDSVILLELSSDSFEAGLNRLINGFDHLKTQAGTVLVSALKPPLDIAVALLNLVADNATAVTYVLGTLFVSVLGKILQSMLAVASATRLNVVLLKLMGLESNRVGAAVFASSSRMAKGMMILNNAIKLTVASAKALISSLIIPAAVIAGWNLISARFDGGGAEARANTRLSKKLKEESKQRDEDLEKAKNFTTNQSTDSLKARFLFRLDQSFGGDDKTFGSILKGLTPWANSEMDQKDRRFKSLDKNNSYRNTTLEGVTNRLEGLDPSTIAKRMREIEGEIAMVDVQRSLAGKNQDFSGLLSLDKQRSTLVQEQTDLTKSITSDSTLISQALKSLETDRQFLTEDLNKGAISNSNYQDKLRAIDSQIADFKATEATIQAVLKTIGLDIELAFQNIADDVSNAMWAIDGARKATAIANLQSYFKGDISSQDLTNFNSRNTLEDNRSQLKKMNAGVDLRKQSLGEVNEGVRNAGFARLGIKTFVPTRRGGYSVPLEDNLNEALNLSPEAIERAAKEMEQEQPAVAAFLRTLAELDKAADDAVTKQLEVNQSQKDYADTLKDNAASLRDLGTSLRDLARSQEDMAIERQRFAEDFPLQVEKTHRDLNRAARDIAESYQDFLLDLEGQIIDAKITLAETQKRIRDNALDISTLETFGSTQGFGLDLNDLFVNYLKAIQPADTIQLEQDKTRLDLEKEATQLARQVRDLQEQEENMQLDRLEQLRQLQREQEDFNRQQRRTWEDAIEQAYSIAVQANELGIDLNQVANGVATQGNGLITSLNHLSQSIIKKSEEIKNTANAEASGQYYGTYFERAAKILRQEEGFSTTAYWDVNAWRVGYGTEFKANQGNAYNKDSTITREEAENQLVKYDLPRFEERILYQVGKKYWNALNDNVKAALLSVAYNRGSLTKALTTAAQSGDTNQIARTIEQTDAETHGARRQREAQLVLTKDTKIESLPVPSLPKPQKISNLLPPPPPLPQLQVIYPRMGTSHESQVTSDLLPPTSDFKEKVEVEKSLSELYDIKQQEAELRKQEQVQQETLAWLQLVSGLGSKQKEMGDYFRNLQREAQTRAIELEQMSANSKGYLTQEEQVKFAGQETQNTYQDRIRQLEDEQRASGEVLDSYNKLLAIDSPIALLAAEGNEDAIAVIGMVEQYKTELLKLMETRGADQSALIEEMTKAVDSSKLERAFQLDIERREQLLDRQEQLLSAQKGLTSDSFIHDLEYSDRDRQIGEAKIKLQYEQDVRNLRELQGSNKALIEQFEQLEAVAKKAKIGSEYEKAVKRLTGFEAANKKLLEQRQKLQKDLESADTGKTYVSAHKALRDFETAHKDVFAQQSKLQKAIAQDTISQKYQESTQKLVSFASEHSSLLEQYDSLQQKTRTAKGFGYRDALVELKAFKNEHKELVRQYEKLQKAVREAEGSEAYQRATKALEEFSSKNGEAINKYKEHRDAIGEVTQAELEKIAMETNKYVRLFNESIQPALNGLLDDFIDDSVTASKAWENFAKSILLSLSEILMAYAKNEILKMIFTDKGQKPSSEDQETGSKGVITDVIGIGANIASNSLNNSNQQQSQPASGGFWNNAIALAANTIPLFFRDGGDTADMVIPNARYGFDSDDVMMAKGLREAMQREAHPEAFPAVLHKGEVVLSDLNGDAQLIRQLKSSGEWNQMKNPSYQPAKIDNFRNGSSFSAANGGKSGETNIYFSSAVNVNATDANSFRKTQDQISREQQRQMKKAKR